MSHSNTISAARRRADRTILAQRRKVEEEELILVEVCRGLRLGFGETMEIASLVMREAPDIELTGVDGSRIGVEVTELRHEVDARDDAAIERLCRDLLSALGQERVHVACEAHVGRGVGALRENEVRSLQGGLVALGRECQTGDETRTWSEAELRSLGLPCLREVTLTAIPGGASLGLWPPPEMLDPEFVQRSIARKNALIETYRNALPGTELWLVLRIGRRSSRTRWDTLIAHHVYESAFDRTLCYEPYEGALLALTTRRPDQ